MPDNDQIIQQQLNTLINGIGDTQVETHQIKEQIKNLRSEYEAAREEAKNGTPEEKSAFALYQTALADGLPGMTKGTLAAITAFQQQPPDAISGSAAVMDICSSLASALGGLSTAGGPPGALIGALFSMVSMILNFFAPKPPSLISQIEKLMRDLEAEKAQSQIEAAGSAVSAYAEGCNYFMQPLPGGGVQDPGPLSIELEKFNLLEGNTITTIRTARNWLLREGNQQTNGWPVVLNLVNDCYMHLMLAVTKQNLYAHDAKKIKSYVGDPNPDPVKKASWAELQRRVEVKFENLKINNSQASEFLAKAVPVARKRGLYIIARAGRQVYIATGPKAFTENAFGDAIFDDCRRMSITRPKEGVNNPATLYDLWILDSGYTNFAYHDKINGQTRTRIHEHADYVGGQSPVGQQFLDWWAVPASGNTFKVYATRNYAVGGALEVWEWDKDANTFERENWRPLTGPTLEQVRVALSLAAVPDDPDKDELPESMLKDGYIIYGSLKDSKDLFVWEGGRQSSVPIPMSVYSGISVDPSFIWVYGREGFVCATHASVMSCINKKRGMPLWLGPPAKNLSPVLDLSSCEDGTLLVSTPDRLATALFHVDFKTPGVGEGQRLIIEEWENLHDGWNAAQVQKLPIFGWPLIERSVAATAQPAA